MDRPYRLKKEVDARDKIVFSNTVVVVHRVVGALNDLSPPHQHTPSHLHSCVHTSLLTCTHGSASSSSVTPSLSTISSVVSPIGLLLTLASSSRRFIQLRMAASLWSRVRISCNTKEERRGGGRVHRGRLWTVREHLRKNARDIIGATATQCGRALHAIAAFARQEDQREGVWGGAMAAGNNRPRQMTRAANDRVLIAFLASQCFTSTSYSLCAGAASPVKASPAMGLLASWSGVSRCGSADGGGIWPVETSFA